MMSNYLDLLERQKSSGSYWQKLFGEHFSSKMFFDASDTNAICITAQYNALDNLFENMPATLSKVELAKISKAIEIQKKKIARDIHYPEDR